MAKIVSTNAQLFIGGTDLSDHCKSLKVDWGQETRDVSTMGNTQRVYRSGVQTASAEAVFFNDHATGSVEPTLRALVIGSTDTGFTVNFRAVNGTISATNPQFSGQAVLDGSLETLSDEHGEVAEITARMLPYSSWSVVTTSS
jgi:hypothetical protein